MEGPRLRRVLFTQLVFLSILFCSMRAEALRCGNKLVLDGMLESEVRNACGEPESVKHLGYVVRQYGPFVGNRSNRRQGGWRQEVAVTELIYNFGPNRLMRKLRFEGDILTSIRTLGYGYR